MDLLEIDEIQARAILDMQLRRLAALERQQLIDEYDELMAEIADYEAILASPERQRQIIGTELAEIVAKYGDDRRTADHRLRRRRVRWRTSSPRRTWSSRSPAAATPSAPRPTCTARSAAAARACAGPQLRADDIVEHFFVTSTHNWILFFTNKGRVYRAKAYELPEAARDARGQHVANLLAFQPDERIAEVLALPDYTVAPYLVLATSSGLVKKTHADRLRLAAVRRHHRDQPARGRRGDRGPAGLGRARTCCWSARTPRRSGSAPTTRRCGRWAGPPPASSACGSARATSCSACTWSRDGADVLVATGGGYAKRTPADQYPVQGRGGQGVLTARIVEARGELVGALMVLPGGRGLRDHLGRRRDQDVRGRDQAVGPADHGGPAGQPGPRAEPGGHRAQRGVARRGQRRPGRRRERTTRRCRGR